ncbi:MAG: outer membrane protein assembly factor BamA [Candidatus Omnitrophica bacterium]|nr:outer membrane protein assembly factor BamA [Candidatus Omnitrophota bacterium]
MKRNIILPVMITILFCAGNLFAQKASRIVKEIDVLNNKVVSKQTIISKLQTKERGEYSPMVLSDDIKRLYATGLFDDVSANVVDLDKGVKVIFNVQEKPVLEKIVFFGNKRIKRRKLLSQMKIKKGEILDQFKLKDDIEALKKLYAEKGYALAQIDYRLEVKESKVTVTITVTENARSRIKKICFEGNNAFNSKRLLKLIKTKKRGWFNSGFLKEGILEEDTDRFIAFYQSEGFVDVKIDSRVEYRKNNTQLYILFKIEEGKQYKIGTVKITGNAVFPDVRLKEGLELIRDKVYSEYKLRSDVSKIQNIYFDEGYISTTVKADTVLNAQTGRVDIGYSVREGSIAYVDKVNVTGNTRTKDMIVRREVKLFPGDRYNGEKLRRSRERMYNLGYFEEVTFDTAEKPTTLPDKYDLDVFVKESKTGEFSFGAGYSSVDKFVGFVDLTQRNFDLFNAPTFTGAGQKLRVRMEFGSARKDYELGFVEPWFLGYPLSVGFNLYSRTRDWDKYDEKRIGGNVFLGKEFGEYWQAKVTHRYEGIRISNVTDDASNDIRAETGKNYISSLAFDITHDTRDSIYNPTKGLLNIYSLEYAGGMLGGDKDFVRYQTMHSKYFPVGEKSVFEVKGRAGMIEAFDDSKEVPIYERFYAGGANTIRGYKERRVGPEGEQGDPVGGRIQAIFNAEYTYNLAKNLKWAFFYDIGNVWRTLNDFHWDMLKLKASIGTGIRVKTPLGPIRLDYGYALDPKEGDSRGRFHFSMSHEF